MTNIYDVLDPPKTPPPSAPANVYDQLDPRPASQFPEYSPGGNGQPTRITVRPRSTMPDDEAGTNAVVQKNSMRADIGVPSSIGVGAVNGATANFADELQGAYASGLPSGGRVEREGPGTVIGGLARLAYEHATGQPGEATKAYEEARDKWRQTTDLAHEQHPTATAVGNIAGGLAIPGAAVVRGATLAPRIASGAITGGIVGGLSGIGEGEDLADRAVKGAAGTAVGTAAGAVSVPLGDLVARGINAVGRYTAQLYRGIRNPEDEAARRVAQEVVDAQARGGQDVIPIGEMAARQANGQPVTNLDIAGQGGRKLARSAKNTPDANEGTQALQGMVQDRFQSQADRTSAFLDRNTPWKNNATFERILEASRSANAPAYRQAYAEGRAAIGSGQNYNPDAFLTPELKRLAGAPDIADAFGTVGRKEGNRTIIEGFQSPRQSPFTRDENGRLVARQMENGNTAIPDLPAWDQVQRVLRAKASAATQAGDRDSARQINILREQLNNELDRIVPSFANARGAAWRGFRAEDAYEAGGNYLSSTATGREAEALQRQIANMTQPERHLFAAGFAQELIAKVRNIGDSADVVRRIYNSPEARDRIREAVGPNLARELESFLHVESVMNYGRNAVQGNSSTVAQLLSAGMAGSLGYGAITGHWDASSLAAGAASAGGRRVMMGAQARMANRIGEMLASDDPHVFVRGITVLSNSNNLLNNLRATVDRIASRTPSQQIGGVAGEAARGIMRADDNKEPVPGPAN